MIHCHIRTVHRELLFMEVEKHFIFLRRVDEQPTTATNLHFVILSDKTLQEYLASGRIIIETLGENEIQPS